MVLRAAQTIRTTVNSFHILNYSMDNRIIEGGSKIMNDAALIREIEMKYPNTAGLVVLKKEGLFMSGILMDITRLIRFIFFR